MGSLYNLYQKTNEGGNIFVCYLTNLQFKFLKGMFSRVRVGHDYVDACNKSDGYHDTAGISLFHIILVLL